MTLELTLTVAYDTKGVTEEWLRDQLFQLVREAVGNGNLTGNSEAEVMWWNSHVTREDG